MGRPHRLRSLALSLLSVVALSCVPGAATIAAAPQAGGEQPQASVGAELVLRALSLLGVNYKFGGNSPDTGLDCSGLVRHVFQEAVGLVLPRRAEEMSRNGDVVGRDQLRPGDLVFFNTLRRAFSHVGIYIGNGRFVHAPSSGGEVRVESLSERYWRNRFNGARRMLASGEEEPLSATAFRPAAERVWQPPSFEVLSAPAYPAAPARTSTPDRPTDADRRLEGFPGAGSPYLH